jgi:FkbM family methyltransferase
MTHDCPMISYSQNFEDVVLNRVFQDVACGFYVDVGANHPVNDSVTKHFYDEGWSGINVEPGRIYATLAAGRPRDLNLNLVASDVAGEVSFYEGTAPGMAGVAATLPESIRRFDGDRRASTKPALPLKDILALHAAGRVIEFLSIDVEGHERAVIAGNDWSRFRPRVLVIESTLPGTPTPCHENWEDLLLAADYRFAYFDGLNRFYLRAEDYDRLHGRFGPPCVFDRFITAELHQLRTGSPDVVAATRELTAERNYLARHVDELHHIIEEQQRLLEGVGYRSLKVAKFISGLRRKLRVAA